MNNKHLVAFAVACFFVQAARAQLAPESSANSGAAALQQALHSLSSNIQQTKAANGGRIVGQQPVKSADGNVWEVGYVVGRPVKISRKGMVKTWEAIIMTGQFDGDPNFAVGSTFEMSVKDESIDIVKKFDGLDKTKNYVFKYRRPHPMNPIWQDTHYLITDIFDVKDPASLPANFPNEVQTDRGRHGTQSNGDIQGRIISVERWGYMTPVCAFELTTGGIQQGSKDSGTDLHAVGYAVYSEEACAFAEALMQHQATVQVHYSQDYIEIWDSYDHIGENIKIVANAATAAQQPGQQLNDLEKQLLSDPKFIQELAKRVAQQQAQQPTN